jgi:transcriptional regulator with AAA-type ATPase domain
MSAATSAHRLAVVELRLPALRERREDVPLLATEFARRYGEKFGLDELSLSSALLDKLRRAEWPGNVRQLENAIARIAALSQGGEVDADTFDDGSPRTHELPEGVGSMLDGPSLREQVEGQHAAQQRPHAQLLRGQLFVPWLAGRLRQQARHGGSEQDVLLAAQAEGRTLPVVIPCVYLRGMIHRVSVQPDSPIKTMADLKGKTIGVPTLAAGQVPYLKEIAKAVGIDPDSIRMVAVG